MRRMRKSSLLVMAAMLLAACGSGDESGSSDAEAAEGANGPGAVAASETIAQLEQPLEFEAPGPPIEAAGAVGSSVYFITAALDFEFTQAVLAGMKDAASELDIEITALDAKGDPSTAARQIDQAISQGVAAIAVMNFPAEVLEAPIKEARDAGIPVVMMFAGDAGLPTPEHQELGVFANASYCYSCAGRQLAAMAVAQSDGPVHAAVVTVPEVASATLESAAFEDELSKLCPECTAKVFEAPIAQWSTDLPAIASSILQEQDVNFIVPVWDAMVGIMKPSLLAAGADDVSIVSYNATLPAMENLRDEDLVSGLVGSPEEWAGWGAVDQLLRGIVGADPAESVDPGNRAFTRNNIGELDIAPGQNSTWYGDTDFRAEFLKLWGVDDQ